MIGERATLPTPRQVMATIEVVPGIAPHLPDRSTWQCVGCPDPWPCPWARAHIGAWVDGDRILLAMLMVQILHVAVGDLADVPGEHDLYERLVGWTR